MSKVGLLLEGGGMRGIFTAGIVDYLLEKDVKFPYVIGVSAGAGAATNYVTKQIGRTKKTISHEGKKPYYGLESLRSCHRLLDLERFVDGYCLDDFPLDFDTYFASDIDFEMVATDIIDAKAVYFPKAITKDELLRNGKATCAVPFTCDPVDIDGHLFLDGSIADSIPLQRCLDKGCDKIVVVMTKPKGAPPTDYHKYKPLIKKMYSKNYPEFADMLLKRSVYYSAQVSYLNRLEEEGKAFVIRPDENLVAHFESDSAKLEKGYQAGYDKMSKMYEDLLSFLC